MSALRELLARFSIDLDEKGARKAESTIERIAGQAEKLGAAIVGAFAFHEVGEFIKGQIEAGSAVHDTALKLGVSNQELQKFQYLGKLAGVSAEEMSGGLGHANRTIGEAATGNAEAAKTFASLGINVKDASGHVRSASDVTLDLVDKLSGMGSQAERTAAITKVMGRAGAQLLPAFSDGAEGVKKAFEEFEALGGGMSDDFVNAADEAGDQLDRFRFAFGALKSRIAGAVLPTLTKVTTWLTKGVAWFTRIADKTNAAAAAFTFLTGGGVIFGLLKILRVLGLTNTGVGGLLKSLLKFGPIALLVGALFLVFEDLYTLATGGDSLIGRLLGDEKSRALVADLKKAFDDMKPAIMQLLPILADLGQKLLKAFVDALPAITQVLSVVLRGISAAVQLFAGGIKAADKALHGDWSGAGKEVDKAGDAIFGKNGVFSGLLDNFGGNTSTRLSDTPAWKQTMPPAQLASEKALREVTDFKQTNQISVTVQGGYTNTETGRIVAGAITDAQKEKQHTLAAVRSLAPAPAGG